MKKDKQNHILTDEEIVCLKKARKIFNKIHRKLTSLEEKRNKCDVQDLSEDNWSKITTELYDDLDFLYKKLHIDAYREKGDTYPMFVKEIER